MSRKTIPFDEALLREIADEYGTPVYVYDEAGIRANAQQLTASFSAWSRQYKNYFAVKATPTPEILRVLVAEGFGFDCSSRAELMMVDQLDLPNVDLFYTSNNTPNRDYELAAQLGATINIDKAEYLAQVKAVLSEPPPSMAVRFNPGEIGVGNEIIGHPKKAKFGDVRENVIKAVVEMHRWGVSNIGLHTMVVSNEKDHRKFAAVARSLRGLAMEIEATQGISVGFINIGGGIGVQYHPEDDPPVDLPSISAAVEAELESLQVPVVSECGRYVTGPHGYLLSRVTHGIVESFEPFLQIDSSINNIARLATVTAAYHQLDLLGRMEDPLRPMNVTGSMCANTDIMFKAYNEDGTPKYQLPITAMPGDLLLVHDAGAHCRSNSHNYNFRLRCGEVLVRIDGTHHLIRRHETEEDLLRTTEGL